LSAIAAAWRLWDEKTVEVCPCLYISPEPAEGLTWLGKAAENLVKYPQTIFSKP
jgi:aldehyde:ferredoxin oxidoreductase